MAILRELLPDNCSHPHICLGTISKAVVKILSGLFPGFNLNGSSENMGLRIGLGHSFDRKWELKGPSSGQRAYCLK